MKSVLVTGANRGLGYGFVQHLLSSGYQVFGGVQKISENLPKQENLLWVELDVTNDASITSAFEFVSKKTTSLDMLINNAGVNKDTLAHWKKESVCNLLDLERDALLEMFNINTIGPILITKQFIPLLKNTPSFVINISSCRASFHDEFENVTGNYGYRASKIALNMMTFCSVFDLPKDIRTFAVHPGNVKTDMNPSGENNPIDRAEKIMKITENWKEEFNGAFMRHDGKPYPL